MGTALGELREATRKGWMHKQGHKVKNWKRRWFVLKGWFHLSYLCCAFSAEKDQTNLKAIPFSRSDKKLFYFSPQHTDVSGHLNLFPPPY